VVRRGRVKRRGPERYFFATLALKTSRASVEDSVLSTRWATAHVGMKALWRQRCDLRRADELERKGRRENGREGGGELAIPRSAFWAWVLGKKEVELLLRRSIRVCIPFYSIPRRFFDATGLCYKGHVPLRGLPSAVIPPEFTETIIP
jgi:hypothetical protein